MKSKLKSWVKAHKTPLSELSRELNIPYKVVIDIANLRCNQANHLLKVSARTGIDMVHLISRRYLDDIKRVNILRKNIFVGPTYKCIKKTFLSDYEYPHNSIFEKVYEDLEVVQLRCKRQILHTITTRNFNENFVSKER